MYKFIIDPSTNLSESILSKKGKNILKKYLRTGLGGEEPVEEATNALKKPAEAARMNAEADARVAAAAAARVGKFPCPASYDCIQKVKLYEVLKEQLKYDGMETPKASREALVDLKAKVAAEVPAILNTELKEIMSDAHYGKYTEYVNLSTDEDALARNLETFYKSLTIDDKKKKFQLENIPRIMKIKKFKNNPNYVFYTLFLKYYYPKSYFESISPKNTLFNLVKCTNTIEECQKKQEPVEAMNLHLHLICPITKGLMIYPVIAEDGYCYEQEAIERWLEINKTSPKTKLPLTNKLIPNTNLKLVIEQLVSLGKVDEKLCADYKEKKEKYTIRDQKEMSYEKMKDHPSESAAEKEPENDRGDDNWWWWWWS